jgi:hypothetical protein
MMRCSVPRRLVDVGDRCALPSLPTINSRAMAPVIKVKRPVFSAGGIMTWLELKFDALMHPRPHCAQ